MIGQAICGLTLLTVGIVEGDKDLLSRNPMFNNEVTERMCNGSSAVMY